MENSSDDAHQATDSGSNFHDLSKPRRKKFTKEERDKLRGVIENADRFGLLDTAAAHMVNVSGETKDIVYQLKRKQIEERT